jgi:hypothetical protein
MANKCDLLGWTIFLREDSGNVNLYSKGSKVGEWLEGWLWFWF